MFPAPRPFPLTLVLVVGEGIGAERLVVRNEDVAAYAAGQAVPSRWASMADLIPLVPGSQRWFYCTWESWR